MNSEHPRKSIESRNVQHDPFSEAAVEGLLRDIAATESTGIPAALGERLRRIPEELSGASELSNSSELPERIEGYVILERLRSGGMGGVFRARHSVLDREVALKTMLPQKLHSSNGTARFQREMRALAALGE